MSLELLRVILCFALGELISRCGLILIPAPILGLIALYMNLLYLKRVPEELSRLAERTLQHFGLLFVPAGVGIITQVHAFDSVLPALLAAVLIGTAVTLTITALVADYLVQALERPRRFRRGDVAHQQAAHA